MTIRLLPLLLLTLLPALLAAQPLADPYEFWFAADRSVDTSLSPRRAEPAGSRGRITVGEDGHFVDASGERVRFFGTTLQWGGNFPDSVTAISAAKRLRALGFNAVRFTAFDYPFARTVSILADGAKTGALDSTQMKKLDWFIYQLKQHGIYSVLTLHAAWRPRAEDGVRQSDSTGWGARVPFWYDRVVQNIVLGTTRRLLTHVNRYTGLAYKDEPAIPYVVVSEDNSFNLYWLYTPDVVRQGQTGTVTVGQLHHAHLDSLWNSWLWTKYTTNAALTSAWNAPAADTASIVRDGDFEDPFSTAWALAVNTTGGAQAIASPSDADKAEGASSMRIRINKLDATRSQFTIAYYQLISKLRHDRRYRLSYWAKTTPSRGTRTMNIYVYNGAYPYNSYGVNKAQAITSTWQKYTLDFTSFVTDSTSGTIAFQLGADSGDVYFDDIRLNEIGFAALRPGESLTARSIQRTPLADENVSPKRNADYQSFYGGLVSNTMNRFKRLITDTLQSAVLVCGVTRPIGFSEQHAMKELDVTSATDWRGDSQSILFNQNGGNPWAVTHQAIKGKPHVVNFVATQHPRPWMNEMATVIPSYAGLQDMDAVFLGLFTQNTNWAGPKIDSLQNWELYNKPAALALVPSVAAAFLRGDIQTSQKEILVEHSAAALTNQRLYTPQAWSLPIYSDVRTSLFRRMRSANDISAQDSYLPHLEVPVLAQTPVDARALDAENGQQFWDAVAGTLRVQTPKFLSLSGDLTSNLFDLNGVLIEQVSTNVKHAVVTVSTLTEDPILESSAMLVTIATRQLNRGAKYASDNINLVSWGNGPVELEGVTMRITLPIAADTVLVTPLGADGLPKGPAIAARKGASGKHTATINTTELGTPWYRVEPKMSVSVEDHMNIAMTMWPNPAVEHVTVRAGQPIDHVDLVGVDGRVVVTASGSGAEATSLRVGDVPTGMYFVRIFSGGQAVERPITIIH